MENIDYIKKLEESNITLITDYLADNYEILHDTFVNKLSNTSEWTFTIIKDLSIIYSIGEETTTKYIKTWALSKGVDKEKWDRNYLSQALKYIIKPTMHEDLERLVGINAERQMITIISEEIRKEIDSKILKELKTKVATFGEFENLLKCLGYKISTIYCPNTFQANKRIITITDYDKINEQQNNPYWKDWFRARGQNQKT